MSRFAILLAGLLLAACANDRNGPVACTEIGCSDGLRVRLLGSHPATFTITATASDGLTRSIRCGVDRPCGNIVFLPDFAPERATVRVESDAGTVEREFTPTYEEVRPNGPGCPPVCRQGEVEIEVRPV